MNRRMFLKTGGAVLAVTAASGVFWAGTRSPIRAIEPWKQAARGFGDARIDALAYAVLAPSPHNRQPWQATLIGDNTIDLYCDLNRRLPQTDPYDRQILMGLGCFTELLNMAAAHKGFQCDIQLFPDGLPDARLDQRRIATITLQTHQPYTDPLFNHIFQRRSIKETFDKTRKLSAHQLASLLTEPMAKGTIDPTLVSKINQQTYDAMKVEFLTPHTLKESTDLMRFGKSEIEANPDGIDIGGIDMELLTHAGILTREEFSNPKGYLVRDYLAGLDARYASTAGYIWLSSQGNSRLEQFKAGRQYVRLNLKATALGISMQPVSQLLQEYPEMNELYQSFHQTVKESSPARVQMLARIGFGPDVPQTPRWAVESIISRA